MATPARTTYQAVQGYIDKAGRKSSTRFNVSAADVTAWGADVTTGNIFSVFQAIEALTVDNVSLRRAARYFDDPGATSVLPTTEAAVNSAKLIALLQDTTTGKKFSMQIPARDTTKYNSARGEVIMSGAGATTEVTTFKTQVESNVLSEDGNNVIVYLIKVIGKGTAA